MLIPIGVDVPFDRRPFLNWMVVVATVLIFGLQIAVTMQDQSGHSVREEPVLVVQEESGLEMQEESDLEKRDKIDLAVKKEFGSMSGFVLRGFNIGGLFGHMWIHGGLMHIIGNMLFLWVFGNAVCSKIGNALYFPVYVLLGLAAAVTFNIFSNMPMIGASGAVNGIVGMYLIFFPLNDITCFYWFYYSFGTFSLSSFWMILLWFAFDIFGVVSGGGGVAYTAHVGGFAVGVALAITLLKTGVVQMENDERSLLDVLGGNNDRKAEEDRLWEMRHNNSALHRELHQAENEAAQDNSGYNEGGTWEAHATEIEAPAPKIRTIEIPAMQADDGYIRFACECGKKLKMASEHAGKKGKCPRCTKRILVPG